MKPLLERKRRARINRCLDELRDLLVSALQQQGEAVTRLEKADILELTVRHVRRLSQRRRLALPTPAVKHQQECEDVAKFQQGFVAAAQQVQNFLMNTNSLEPTVSTRLLSHLTNYATSITPSPAIATTPVCSPVHQQQPSPIPPQQLVTPPQRQPPPPPPPPAPIQSVIIPKKVSMSTPPSTHFSTTGRDNLPQSRLVSNQRSIPVSAESASNSNYQTNQKLLPHRAPLPLIDMSNRQSSPATTVSFTAPIIRNVKPQDRLVAPSPFIDVVSTENDTPIDFKYNTVVKTETPYSIVNSSEINSDMSIIRLQAKVVAHARTLQYMVSSSHQNRESPSPGRASPLPEDLSMKKYPNDSSWRPW